MKKKSKALRIINFVASLFYTAPRQPSPGSITYSTSLTRENINFTSADGNQIPMGTSYRATPGGYEWWQLKETGYWDYSCAIIWTELQTHTAPLKITGHIKKIQLEMQAPTSAISLRSGRPKSTTIRDLTSPGTKHLSHLSMTQYSEEAFANEVRCLLPQVA